MYGEETVPVQVQVLPGFPAAPQQSIVLDLASIVLLPENNHAVSGFGFPHGQTLSQRQEATSDGKGREL